MSVDKSLYQQMLEAIGTQQGFDQSFYSQGHYANQGLNFLKDQKDSPEKEQLASVLKSQKGQAIAGGVMAGLNGLTGIAGNVYNLAQTAETNGQENDIQQIKSVGTQNYNNYNQLLQGYNSLDNINPDLSFDSIRGGSTGERVGNVFSSTLTGATTGLSIGGPWGALAGAVVGLGAGVGGWLFGDAKAREKQRQLKWNANIAQKDANINLSAQSDRISELNYRSGIANRSALGGRIEKKQQSILDYAERVLKQRNYSSINPGNKIIRRHCNGGTMIRLKVK